MATLLLALLIGIVAGLRTFMAPAAVSWAARHAAGDGHALDFMGLRFTPWVFTLLAATELVVDQLPGTPSRKVPMQFGARLISGALCGGTIGSRNDMAAAFGSDRPAALVEDAIAIGAAFGIACAWGAGR